MINGRLITSGGLFFLALLTPTVFGDLDLCSLVSCGKGACHFKPDYIPHGYTCECDSGWRRTRLPDSEEQYLQFLPCIIPNCSINYSCMLAPPPLPPIPTNPCNDSIFDPCYWIYCGEGMCTKSSDHIHACQCQSGAYNLLNISHFPCYSDCAIGSDCSKLGIKVSKASIPTDSGSTPITATANNGVHPRRSNWTILAMIFWLLFQGNGVFVATQ